MNVTLRVDSDRPRPGDRVELHGWQSPAGELVSYLPGASPKIAVVWVPGGSVFASRGMTRYHPSTIYVFELHEAFSASDDHSAGAHDIVSFPGSYRRSKLAPARSY